MVFSFANARADGGIRATEWFLRTARLSVAVARIRGPANTCQDCGLLLRLEEEPSSDRSVAPVMVFIPSAQQGCPNGRTWSFPQEDR